MRTRVLAWLRAGYPQGIPARDYVALLGVLRRQLTDEDVDLIAGQLAAQADADGGAVTEQDIHDMVRTQALQSATDEDVRRVSAQLAAGGWPLATYTDRDGPSTVDRRRG
nr:DUF3349 domain-containing protein [Nocardioides lijunqiniae]